MTVELERTTDVSMLATLTSRRDRVGVVILLCFQRDHMQDACAEQPPGWDVTQGPENLKWQKYWRHLLHEGRDSMPEEVYNLVSQLLEERTSKRPTTRSIFNQDSYFNRAHMGRYPYSSTCTWGLG